LLEKKDGFIVVKLKIYPAAKLRTRLDAPAIVHLVAVSGVAQIEANQCKPILNQGESITIAEKGLVSIENKGDQPICLIQVQIAG
jgi:hypothetical protein